MKISTRSYARSSAAGRVGGVALATMALFAILSTRCYPAVSEGDRCDPALSHDECANDPAIQCVVPTNCAIAYCCGPTSTAATCQPCASPAVDGGSDAAGE